MMSETAREKKWPKRVAVGVLLLGALVCFGHALFFAWVKRDGAATLMGTLFVVLVLMTYLSEMETFKAFGIEMKLRARLNDAEELLKKLRAVTVLNADTAFHLLTYTGRWDYSAREQFRLAATVDAFMKDMNCDAEEMKRAKAPFIRMALRDLFVVYHNAVMHLLHRQKGKASPESIEAIEHFVKLRNTLPFNENDFRASCAAMAPPDNVLPKEDHEFLNELWVKLVKLADDLRAKGELSNAGIELLANRTTDAENIEWMKNWNP
jgi:hypothetical protein